jgi:hypothetical protein
MIWYVCKWTLFGKKRAKTHNAFALCRQKTSEQKMRGDTAPALSC